MPAPPLAVAAAERLSGLVALVRMLSSQTVDGLVASLLPGDLDASYFVAEPAAVARLLAAMTRATSESMRAGDAAVTAWSQASSALSILPKPAAGLLPTASDLASVLRQTVLVESKYRIGGGATPAEALESARLRGGRAAANIGADTTRGGYTHRIADAGLGWARVPTAQACPWCLLMASRGPVYHSKQTAQGKKGFYHPWDRCRTLAVPRGAQFADYLDGEIGELVGDAANAWNTTGRMDSYLASDFAKTRNRARTGSSAPSQPPQPQNPDPVFGVVPTTITPDRALAGTNPQYASGQAQYKQNCTRCVVAYEARRRGLDVEASASAADDMVAVTNATFDLPAGSTQHAWRKPGYGSVAAAEAEVSAAPVGSRHWMHVTWPNGHDAHVFIAENRNGTTVLIDPQSGTEPYIPSTIMPGSARLLRVDNLDFAQGAAGFTMTP